MFGWGMMCGWSSFWACLGTWLLIEVLAIGLLYVLSVALLSPNRPTGCWSRVSTLWEAGWSPGVVMVVWSYV